MKYVLGRKEKSGRAKKMREEKRCLVKREQIEKFEK